MRVRRLSLHREVLTELSPGDLSFVVAGAVVTTPMLDCEIGDLSDRLANCDSYLRPCISHTCTR